jgi:hypothetical protein
MKKGTKILLLWSAIISGFALVLFGQKQQPFGYAQLIVTAIQVLIALIASFLAVHEPNRKNRFLFLNFSFFFFLSVLSLLSTLLQSLLASIDVYLPFKIAQYIKGIHYGVLAFAIVYLVIDSLFRDLRIFHKYAATAVIVFAFFISYFSSFLADPKYGYTTADIQDFRAVDRMYTTLINSTAKVPTPEEVAQQLSLPAWGDFQPVGKLYAENNLQRIKEIFAYLPGDNYNILLYKPIHVYVIKMNVVACFFIVLFFGYQYKKDPPQGAYVDKIMFLLLLFCSMEIFHAWSFIHTVEWEEFLQIFVIGQYITIFILLMLAMFFGLRLRFVTSVAGEFYENELVHSAQHITRWRDWLDNIVLHHFFNPKAIKGVLFSQRTQK